MKDNFSASLACVLRCEGGYVNDSRDPGGATNCGVTQSVYDDWRRSHGQGPRSVRLIDMNEVEAIYRKSYWDAVRGDDLPFGVDYCVFDFAVNSGPPRAIRFLQRAAGVADDGKIGPVTLAAVNDEDPKALIEAICTLRAVYLRSLNTYSAFGRGWMNRVAEVRQDAEGMA